MHARTWKSLLSAYLAARSATSSEELEEAVADLQRLGRESVSCAIVSALAVTQLELPMLLPLAVAACGTSLVLLVSHWVS